MRSFAPSIQHLLRTLTRGDYGEPVLRWSKFVPQGSRCGISGLPCTDADGSVFTVQFSVATRKRTGPPCGSVSFVIHTHFDGVVRVYLAAVAHLAARRLWPREMWTEVWAVLVKRLMKALPMTLLLGI